ncbi:MAG: RNA polymerase factor sigma-54 [Verrucomicrobiota bacterium]
MSQGLGLQQNLSLSQTLSPQMQQSLQYLQAPVMELRALMRQEMEGNPVLEETQPENQESDEEWEKEIDEMRQHDEEWREYFVQQQGAGRPSSEEEKRRQFIFDSLVDQPSLSDHLLEQLTLNTHAPDIQKIGKEIIGNIDQDGFLKALPEEIAEETQTDIESVSHTLELIQSFHPPGVAARDLRESLLIQLKLRGKEHSPEFQIVAGFLDLLGRKRYQEIARKCKLSLERVQEAAAFIARLQPKPGLAFHAEDPQNVVQPEAAILKHEGTWVVQLNRDPVPRLRISDSYKDLLSQSHSDANLKNYLKERIRAGKFLIKSIHQRQQTIEDILNEVVEQQTDFLENGVSHLKPLTMNRVAQSVGVHETTVSRAVANKYIDTPWGVLPMKFFFTSGYRTDDGSRMSNTSVKEAISELIGKEDKSKPLSDTEIVSTLKQRGIKLARRTVAKYRSELNILPSNLRKES